MTAPAGYDARLHKVRVHIETGELFAVDFALEPAGLRKLELALQDEFGRRKVFAVKGLEQFDRFFDRLLERRSFALDRPNVEIKRLFDRRFRDDAQGRLRVFHRARLERFRDGVLAVVTDKPAVQNEFRNVFRRRADAGRPPLILHGAAKRRGRTGVKRDAGLRRSVFKANERFREAVFFENREFAGVCEVPRDAVRGVFRAGRVAVIDDTREERREPLAERFEADGQRRVVPVFFADVIEATDAL